MVTIEEKLAAIKRVHNGEILRKVAADYNVGKSTISDWMKQKDKLEQNISKQQHKKMMKSSKNCKLNEAMFLWFTQQREKGAPLSGPIIQEKARIMFEKLGENTSEFTASTGWLDKWKTRYGIRQLNICGEKLSADRDAVDVFKTEFQEFTEGYTKDQIYNADETGLNFKMLPQKSLASKQEKSAPGHKMNKERITVLACSNASGEHRLPLLCIGKSKNPRALKNIKAHVLPVSYKNQKSAWMSCEIFTEWFHHEFVPKVELFLKSKNLPRKAILLLDNAPTHPTALGNGDIIVKFLPPNVTSLVQPLDQGVLASFKRHYRGLFLRSLLHERNETVSVQEAVKSINMKDVLYWSAQSWDKVKSSTLQKCWNKLYDGIFVSGETESDENLLDLLTEIPGCEAIDNNDVSEWVNSDDLELEYTDDDIVDMVMLPEDDAANEEDNTSDAADDKRVTAEEGFNALDVSISSCKSRFTGLILWAVPCSM